MQAYIVGSDNPYWIMSASKIMSHYCSFFKGSTTMASCSPKGRQTSLIIGEKQHLTNDTIEACPYTTVNQPFSGLSVYKDVTRFDTHEMSIMQPYNSMTQLYNVNSRYTFNGIPLWGQIRSQVGPYWDALLPNMDVLNLNTFKQEVYYIPELNTILSLLNFQ